jgi:hypothetical protein
VPLSVNSESSALPFVRLVCVVVTEAALTVEKPVLFSTVSVEPEPENCRLDPPSAVFSCAMTDAMPPEKSTPTTWSLGSAVALFDSGSTLASSTRMIETSRCVLVAVSV